MFRSFALWVAVLTSFSLAAEPSTSTLRLDEPSSTASRRAGDYRLGFEMELRASEDRRPDRAESRNRQDLHELTAEGEYQIDEDVQAQFEFSFEKFGQESQFVIKEALVSWTPWQNYLTLNLGQQFLPVGLLNEKDNYFSSNPPFLQKILTAQKNIDLGGTLHVKPLNSELLIFEGGQYAGQVVRAEDQRTGSPEQSPRVFSLKSESKFHQAFATYFEHDYAYFDPIRAYGAGFELTAPHEWLIRPSLLAEHWRFREMQREGPDQQHMAWLLYGRVEGWRLAAGYRWSLDSSYLQSSVGRLALADEFSQLMYLEVRLAKPLRLRAEKALDTQGEVLRDEQVIRGLVSFEI